MAASAIITQYGIMIKTLTAEQAKAVRAMCTIRYQPKIGPQQITAVYDASYPTGELAGVLNYNCRTCWRLPLAAISLLREFGISIKAVKPPSQPHVFTIHRELYPSQQLIVSWLMERYYTPAKMRTGLASAIINIRAGTGKTRIAGAIAAAIGQRCLYIVPRVELARQTFKDLRALLGDESAGLYPSAHPIAVAVINTAMKLTPEQIREYGFLIFDEVHEFVSSARAAFMFRCYIPRLGMSATTADRVDKLDRVNELHFSTAGRVIQAEEVPGFSYDETKFNMSAVVIKYFGPPEYTKLLKNEATDMLSTALQWEQLMNDPYRWEVIHCAFERLISRGHHIYIFAEQRAHVEALRNSVVKWLANPADVAAPELDEGISIAADIAEPPAPSEPPELLEPPAPAIQQDKQAQAWMGGCKNSADVINHARVIITTYGYAGTGVSIARMTAILHATSRRSKLSQILGRIRRRDGDMSAPREVIYISDRRAGFSSQLKPQLTAYDYYDMPVTYVSVHWDSPEDMSDIATAGMSVGRSCNSADTASNDTNDVNTMWDDYD